MLVCRRGEKASHMSGGYACGRAQGGVTMSENFARAGGFAAGRNMAIKVAPGEYDSTVDFYRNVIGLPFIREDKDSTVFEFGQANLWIDRVSSMTRAEVWLEIRCSDVDQAAEWFARHQVARCDDVEQLPDDFAGFWVRSPAGIVHLVCAD